MILCHLQEDVRASKAASNQRVLRRARTLLAMHQFAGGPSAGSPLRLSDAETMKTAVSGYVCCAGVSRERKCNIGTG
jgi:hypothetical protein